ncbi:MAG: hypothetical protein M1827_007715 [Pycnora praestabilis]|nr:MAG: hypothetical protein M1827_007715 [Pycnora praestabilis]
MTVLEPPTSPKSRAEPHNAQPSRLALGSQLTRELQLHQTRDFDDERNDVSTIGSKRTPSASPSKRRSLSDAAPPSLSPSPRFRESNRSSKDDITIKTSPTTPRRPSVQARGLSLQMPACEMGSSSSGNLLNRVPLSPKLDSSNSYSVPSSVLPRRSRGMDFSRACTNLHHSTIAEQSSPDSSPTISGRGMMIPPRRGPSTISSGLESPNSTAHSMWSTAANPDRTGVSSSVGSVNMLEMDSESSNSDDEGIIDPNSGEDPIITTPHVHKLGIAQGVSNLFASGLNVSPGGDWMGHYSPAVSSLMSFQRARLRHGRSRKSSSSASGNSSLASPSPASPPVPKTTESIGGGYFTKELSVRGDEVRRESLSLGTHDLHISSGGESDDGGASGITPDDGASGVGATTPSKDEKRGVIRRAVTRRGNLLPKTKNFARIRAALMEEGAPIDTEFRREAEVVRQVRESDTDLEPNVQVSQPNTTDTSPSLLPTVPSLADSLEDIPEDEMMGDDFPAMINEKRASSTFTRQALRNSGGIEFWNSFETGNRTTPPPTLARRSSSAGSYDINMDSPSVLLSTPPSSFVSSTVTEQQLPKLQPSSRSTTPQPQPQPSAAEISRKVNKRRRDDDFDTFSFKRRAVSPGMSLQNSPVLPQSPALKDPGWWGCSNGSRDAPSIANNGHASSDRANSGGSTSGSVSGGAGPKRVGFQGMSDTSDGMMNMSIE